jgi:hypothetical protein
MTVMQAAAIIRLNEIWRELLMMGYMESTICLPAEYFPEHEWNEQQVINGPNGSDLLLKYNTR